MAVPTFPGAWQNRPAMGRRAVTLWVTCLALGVAACGTGPDNPALDRDVERDDSGRILRPGEVGVLRLQVGDCFDDPGDGPTLTVDAVPCRSPHDSEVVGIFDLPDTGWPGAQAVADESLRGCEARFARLGGDVSELDDLGLTALAPTEDSWADDRSVLCVVFTLSGDDVRGSVVSPGA